MLGARVGLRLGSPVGEVEGQRVGVRDGAVLGMLVGREVGVLDGGRVGPRLGEVVGTWRSVGTVEECQSKGMRVKGYWLMARAGEVMLPTAAAHLAL